jgi:site-specific DNA recombinase
MTHPRSLYLREEALCPALDRWLATAFSPTHLRQTIHAPPTLPGPDPTQPPTRSTTPTTACATANGNSPSTAPPWKPAPTPS